LQEIYQEMSNTGESNTPILIQETYANDTQAFEEISKGIADTGIKVRSVMQWQLERAKFIRPDGGRGGWSTVGLRYGNLTCQWPNPSPTPSSTPNNPGDFNQDGSVDIFDYNILIAGFGSEYDIFDYNELVGNYEK